MRLIKPKKGQLLEKQFIEVIELIKKAKYNALKTVNTELINLYWRIGEYINKKLYTSEWGESVVGQLADYIKKSRPELKGYSDKNLWRMRQFYETYYNDEKLSPLMRQLSWTHNLLILSKTKSQSEREFL
ncbi:hypothetical protein HYU06_04710 [Candidatus Woesearchaeota archaeon]|nr:hypothetical protein [Candidatus Woesearchaeota archaeon]